MVYIASEAVYEIIQPKRMILICHLESISHVHIHVEALFANMSLYVHAFLNVNSWTVRASSFSLLTNHMLSVWNNIKISV